MSGGGSAGSRRGESFSAPGAAGLLMMQREAAEVAETTREIGNAYGRPAARSRIVTPNVRHSARAARANESAPKDATSVAAPVFAQSSNPSWKAKYPELVLAVVPAENAAGEKVKPAEKILIQSLTVGAPAAGTPAPSASSQP